MSNRPVTPGAVASDIARVHNVLSQHPDAITYDVTLHLVNDDIYLDELISIETSRDYANNICDYTIVTFTLGMGQYIKRVHPHIDNLEMTIVTKRYGKTYPDRYKLLILNGPTNVAGSNYSSRSESELDRTDKFILEGQCVNRLGEVLRLKTTSGIYSYTTVKDVMRTVIVNTIAESKVDNAEVAVNIDIVEPNNAKEFRHISIPMSDRIRVLDIPSYLQSTDYGVYNTDIGTYIQRIGYFQDGIDPVVTVFVYPLYNSEMTDRPGKKLMILSSPTTTLSLVENSYLIDGDVIKIVGSGNMTGDDRSQNRLINAGNSVITTDPASVMTRAVDVTDDEVVTAMKDNVTGATLRKQRDGFSGANYVGATSNPYKYRSEIAKNLLSQHQVTWNYSNPELLYPGMPVIFVYDDIDKGVIRLNGILHSTFTKYNAAYKAHVTIVNVLLESYIEGMDKSTDSVDVSYK